MTLEMDIAQIQAMNKLGNGKILCGGVGSGKSRTAIAYFYFHSCGGAVPINGEGEFKRMTNPKTLFVITTAMKRDSLDWLSEAALFGISSDRKDSIEGVRIHIDSWNNIRKYEAMKGCFFIFDEQRLVGSGAWVKSFKKIAQNNEWILLSATPGDTWIDYIPVFVANGFFKNTTEFKRHHVVYNRYSKFPKVDYYIGEKKLEKLRKHLLVEIPIKRLTNRIDRWKTVAYDKDLFKRVMVDRWHVYEERPIKNRAELFLIMRKVANSDPSRIDTVCELFKDHPRMVIFYNFNFELDLLRDLADILDVEVGERNGFRHDTVPTGDKWIYLVQYLAGAEAWECTTTDTMVFYSLNYSWKMTEQAKGRIDRLNTPYKDLYYYTLRSMAPIDTAILKTLRKKKTFNERSWIKEF